eukprot:CAMPEP_0197532530 /NCGR_PEP_ID=MMETSP1318-20131121/40063_1 /TAXON_ID=552666 /ORGANISM="Partenskyella glossopodia, Strain RCC365" /LENGTH=41 /DNA_ID= /DNA_START= /DNA_END= /DNA_ORIENTATION=
MMRRLIPAASRGIRARKWLGIPGYCAGGRRGKAGAVDERGW